MTEISTKLRYSVARDPDTNQWIGVVGNDVSVVTVCTEITRERAINWCEHYITTGEELPDAFDRRN